MVLYSYDTDLFISYRLNADFVFYLTFLVIYYCVKMKRKIEIDIHIRQIILAIDYNEEKTTKLLKSKTLHNLYYTHIKLCDDFSIKSNHSLIIYFVRILAINQLNKGY